MDPIMVKYGLMAATPSALMLRRKAYHSPHIDDSSITIATAQSQNQMRPAKNNNAKLSPIPKSP